MESRGRLQKSRTDRMIDGVCGGVAAYFGIDPTLVRVAWVLLTFFGGSGVVLYIACMILMPKEPAAAVAAAGTPDAAAPAGPPPAAGAGGRNQKFWGVLLIVVGGLWLLGNLGVPLWHHWWGWSWDVIVATLFILAGVALMFGGRDGLTRPAPAAEGGAAGTEGGAAAESAATPAAAARDRLHRSRTDRKFLGVCGGLGGYFGIDSTIVRLIAVAAAFASFGIALLAYFLMALVVPQEPAPAAVPAPAPQPAA